MAVPAWYRVSTDKAELVVPIRLYLERIVSEKGYRYNSTFGSKYWFDVCMFFVEIDSLIGYLTMIGAYPDSATVETTDDAGLTWYQVS